MADNDTVTVRIALYQIPILILPLPNEVVKRYGGVNKITERIVGMLSRVSDLITLQHRQLRSSFLVITQTIDAGYADYGCVIIDENSNQLILNENELQRIRQQVRMEYDIIEYTINQLLI